MSRLAGKNVTVIGASEGLGREIAGAARAEGGRVLAVARRSGPLEDLARDLPGVQTLALDATSDDAAGRAFDALTPDLLVLCGGAHPMMAPIQNQSWEQFSTVWNADVKASFAFCSAALRRPLARGSTVVLISSGAGLAGSQLSGSYAGAKRMQMFLAEYAQEQSERLGLGIRFLALVPRQIMPGTPLGKAAVAGYASYLGISPGEFLGRGGNRQTPGDVAAALIALASETEPREGTVFSVSALGIEAVP